MVSDYLSDIVGYMQDAEWHSYIEHLSSGITDHHIMESVLQLAQQVSGGRACAACGDDDKVVEKHGRLRVHLCEYCAKEADEAFEEFDRTVREQDEFREE